MLDHFGKSPPTFQGAHITIVTSDLTNKIVGIHNISASTRMSGINGWKHGIYFIHKIRLHPGVNQ